MLVRTVARALPAPPEILARWRREHGPQPSELRNDGGIDSFAHLRSNGATRRRPRSDWPVGASGRERIVAIDNGQDARTDRDLFAAKTRRVSRSIPSLVMT